MAARRTPPRASAPPPADLESALLRHRVEQLEAALAVLRSEVARGVASLERQLAFAEGRIEQMNSELHRISNGGQMGGILASGGGVPEEEPEKGASLREDLEGAAERYAERFGGGEMSVDRMLSMGGKAYGRKPEA